VTGEQHTQAQQAVERWLEAQQEWWTLLLTGGPSDAIPPDEVARRATEAWRKATYSLVDAQAQVILDAVDGATARDEGPGPGADAARSGDAPAPGSELIDSLRKAAEHLIRSQAEWARSWTDAHTTPAREGEA
jgi:hypothetical protein